MRISIGADHAGYELKDRIKQHLASQGIEVQDRGTSTGDSVDYPDFAQAVALDVVEGRADRGFLVCGTGIGMAISANKVDGVRAANASKEFEAQMAREHNDANILAIGARIVDDPTAFRLVDLFVSTPFAGGRHQRRVEKMMALENSKK